MDVGHCGTITRARHGVPTWAQPDKHAHAHLSRRAACRAVRLLREELQLLQEPGSYVGEVVKVMGKTKVLCKVHPEGKYVVDLDKVSRPPWWGSPPTRLPVPAAAPRGWPSTSLLAPTTACLGMGASRTHTNLQVAYARLLTKWT